MARKPDIHTPIGLTSREAARILGEEGPNELPSSKQRGNLAIALDVMREPMFLLLVACGAIAIWWVTGGAVIFLGLVLYIPFLRGIFRFSSIHPIDVIICISAGMLSVVWFEFFKLFNRKRG
jgi:Ca2+-transporting ATPase